MNKLTKILLWLYFLPFTLDFITAMGAMYVEGHGLSETNPIFILFNRKLIFFVFFLLFSCSVAYFIITLENIKDQWRFFVIAIVMLMLFARGVGIYGNVMHIINPIEQTTIAESPALAVEYATGNLLLYYFKVTFFTIVLPFLALIGTFKLFKIEYATFKK